MDTTKGSWEPTTTHGRAKRKLHPFHGSMAPWLASFVSPKGSNLQGNERDVTSTTGNPATPHESTLSGDRASAVFGVSAQKRASGLASHFQGPALAGMYRYSVVW